MGEEPPTSVGVSQVRKLFDQNWSQAEQADNTMKQSVKLCLQALKEGDKYQAYNLLAKALSLGGKLFSQMGAYLL